MEGGANMRDDEQYPPVHLDLSQVQHKANRQPRRQSQQVREYKRNSRGVHGRGNHNYTLRSAGGKQDADADQEAMIRAALIMATIGTCCLMLPIWLLWEVIHAASKKPAQQQTPQTNSGRDYHRDHDFVMMEGD